MINSTHTNERLCNSLVTWADLKTDGARAWMKNKLSSCDLTNNNPQLASHKIINFISYWFRNYLNLILKTKKFNVNIFTF